MWELHLQFQKTQNVIAVKGYNFKRPFFFSPITCMHTLNVEGGVKS